ncbi:trehalase-like isoform X2 [Aphis gossypii]|uniref:trehalase-like isoform X2 n=1 Tax=Aphis gossypii TaxID=80765 RepID=UPI002158FF5F|nr:trehalase-like isoform X2 [Aphis gossypii]
MWGQHTPCEDWKSGTVYASDELQPTCLSKLYCESEFMHDIQLARLYPDSKTFVDKKLKCTESEILTHYKALKDTHNGNVPPKEELVKFVDDHLEDGDELEVWIPPDFTDTPSIADRIVDESYKQWALGLNQVWKTLARKIKDDVKTNPDKYSLLWVPNGFVIPGGRFREIYYWDTYWIVNGLILCDMKDTARGVIDNVISLVNQFGFMPNGGRAYYLNRSQPPMLILMALSYYKATNDFEYIKKIIPDLESEFHFWTENRMVTFEKDCKSYRMARYYAPSRGPRPESYREDYEVAEKLKTEDEKDDMYSRLKSGAESGWDYSSRWFITTDQVSENADQLSAVHTPSIVPVELNSILNQNARILSTWFGQIGNKYKATKYCVIAQEFLKGIQEVMWRPDRGAWFDWDLINHKNQDCFFVSNIVPLWTGSYNMPKENVANDVLRYLMDEGIVGPDFSISFHGTPTSMHISSQQWDYPNAWPPLQAYIIQGLDRTEQESAKEVAAKMVEVWLSTNYKGFAERSIMFEKYHVETPGETGGGGEYVPQTGFGWTNGIVLEFLDQWCTGCTDTNELQNGNPRNNSSDGSNILKSSFKKFCQFLEDNN